MKTPWLLFPLVLFGQLHAAAPIQGLQDLKSLEAKVQAVSQRNMAATVALISDDANSSGSGVITTADGLILTAAHVVQGMESLRVVFPNGSEVPGKVLGANFSKDIAMVQIQKNGPWPYVEMGESKPLAAGDWVIAMGHSAGFDAARKPPVRFGHVVSEGPGNFLTTDCTLIGGDSGGPLFDLNGKIVGINSSIGVSLTNNNHAGIDGFKEDWADLKAGETWGKLTLNPLANTEKAVLGIVMAPRRGVRGVPVEGLVARSPAAAAGLRAGDVILAMDQNEIPDASMLEILLAKRQAGDTVKLKVLRDRNPLELSITLARRDALFAE